MAVVANPEKDVGGPEVPLGVTSSHRMGHVRASPPAHPEAARTLRASVPPRLTFSAPNPMLSDGAPGLHPVISRINVAITWGAGPPAGSEIMYDKTATALALVLVAGVGGLGMVPGAIAEHNNCHQTFSVVDGEPAVPTLLSGNDFEIGVEDVAAGTDEILHVELTSDDDQLDWTVYMLDANDDCVVYDAVNCDESITTPEEQTCRLDAPGSGSIDYWVVLDNPEDDALLFKAWSTVAP